MTLTGWGKSDRLIVIRVSMAIVRGEVENRRTGALRVLRLYLYRWMTLHESVVEPGMR
jgi:hypothetical protein